MMEWPFVVTKLLKSRNRIERDSFKNLVISHLKLCECNEMQTREIERLKKDNMELQVRAANAGKNNDGGASCDAFTATKMLKLQEELSECLRSKGENSQAIINLNKSLQDRDKCIEQYLHRISEYKVKIETLEIGHTDMVQKLKTAETSYQVLVDEQNALQLAFASLDDRCTSVGRENADLITRLKTLKTADIERLNEQLERDDRERSRIISRGIEEATREHVNVRDPKICHGLNAPHNVCSFTVCIPERPIAVLSSCHESEIYAVKWSPTGRMFASGGSDRKVKLWDKSSGKYISRSTYVGCNNSIYCVEFNTEETLLLATSNDYSSKIWTINDKRLRNSLTGHSGKVMCGKFLPEQTKVVTGSYDRTLKFWDLKRDSCFRTVFAGSICNDLVTFDTMGSAVISCHLNKKIYFWDQKVDSHIKQIVLEGKVTSLDISTDRLTMLTCSRDDKLSIIDLRTDQIVKQYDADGFHVTCDWSRAVFSPDSSYIMAGSSNGDLFIWNVLTGKLESQLHSHKSGVIATSWNVNGNTLLSCDKQKCITVWADY